MIKNIEDLYKNYSNIQNNLHSIVWSIIPPYVDVSTYGGTVIVKPVGDHNYRMEITFDVINAKYLIEYETRIGHMSEDINLSDQNVEHSLKEMILNFIENAATHLLESIAIARSNTKPKKSNKRSKK